MKKGLLEPSENDRLGNRKENNYSIFYQNLIISGLGGFLMLLPVHSFSSMKNAD